MERKSKALIYNAVTSQRINYQPGEREAAALTSSFRRLTWSTGLREYKINPGVGGGFKLVRSRMRSIVDGVATAKFLLVPLNFSSVPLALTTTIPKPPSLRIHSTSYSATLSEVSTSSSNGFISLGRLTLPDFPILHQEVNGSKLVCLDNAATSQKPNLVVKALRGEYYEGYNSNVHRGIHYLSAKATEEYELARKKVAAFINAEEVREIVFTRNATEAINLVAYFWGLSNLKPRDEILW